MGVVFFFSKTSGEPKMYIVLKYWSAGLIHRKAKSRKKYLCTERKIEFEWIYEMRYYRIFHWWDFPLVECFSEVYRLVQKPKSCEEMKKDEVNSTGNNNNNNNNKDKYLDLARELKKLWNMKVMIVPIVIGALDTVTKGLLKGLEDLEVSGRVDTIQMTALLRTARILRRVLGTWGDLLSLKLQWKTIS